MRRKVFVGVPSVSGNISAHLTAFLTALERLNFAPDHTNTYQLSFSLGIHPVEFARNIVVGHFLESDCEWLWFLDADIVPPEDWEGMFSVDGDVIAGRSTFYSGDERTDGPRIGVNTFVKTDGGFRICGYDTIQPEIDACGTSCLLIHRRVFEDPAMKMPGMYVEPISQRLLDAGKRTKDEAFAPPFFVTWYAPNGARTLGEDLDFTWRAKQRGYRVVTAPTAIWDQTKQLSLLGVAKYAAAVVRENAGSEVPHGT